MSSLLRHKNLVMFKQLGVLFESEHGNNVQGVCPFCGKRKFFVNPETRQWDCKVCLLEGGHTKFVDAIVEFAREKAGLREISPLAKAKGLASSTLRRAGVGFLPTSKNYVVPVYKADGSGVWTVQVYDGKILRGLSDHPVGLLGWEKIADSKEVWICEGAWDMFALQQMLAMDHLSGVVVAAPGAGTFKADWSGMFAGKIVHVMYDADLPGKRGANKIANILSSIAKSIDYLIWPSDMKEGYDVRDWMQEHTEESTHSLMAMLSKTPPELPTKGGSGTSGTKEEPPCITVAQDPREGEYVPFSEIEEAYRKWLYLPDTEVLSVMFGTIIANYLEGDPLWTFLVAPPGGTKTELLNTISQAPNVITTSSMTARALVSGSQTAGGADPSLIPRLNGKVLVVKDFTTILNMPQMARDEIFGILRDAYDGKTERDFGNGIHRCYYSRFGFISGVTPAHEQYTEGNSSLGERFLYFNVPIPSDARGREEYMLQAQKNSGREVLMREELSTMGSKVLSFAYPRTPGMPDNLIRKTISLAQLLSKARGTVVRDKFTREITHGAYSEVGTRLTKQFTKMMRGISMLHDEANITMHAYSIVRKMALSTAPHRVETILRNMWLGGCEETYLTEDVADMLDLPKLVSERQLENMKALGLLTRSSLGLGRSAWRLSDDAKYLIETSEAYK